MWKRQFPVLGVTVVWPWAHLHICAVDLIFYLQPSTLVKRSQEDRVKALKLRGVSISRQGYTVHLLVMMKQTWGPHHFTGEAKMTVATLMWFHSSGPVCVASIVVPVTLHTGRSFLDSFCSELTGHHSCPGLLKTSQTELGLSFPGFPVEGPLTGSAALLGAWLEVFVWDGVSMFVSLGPKVYEWTFQGEANRKVLGLPDFWLGLPPEHKSGSLLKIFY